MTANLTSWAHHETFCREGLRLRDKIGQEIPLELWPGQLKLFEAIRKQRLQGRPVRVVGLKCRQVGFSTGTATWMYKRTAFLPGQQTLVMADKHETNTNLFNYYRQLAESYRLKDGPAAPKITRTSMSKGQQEIHFEGDSWIKFGSAESPNTGRSFSVRNLHMSEYAFYGDAVELMKGVMNSIPDDPETSIVIESTANGIGNPFHSLWQQAVDPAAVESDWFGVFFAWWEHPENVRPVSDFHRFQKTLTDEEHKLSGQYNLTLEQINWRRWAIVNKCGGSVDTFHQEQPSCPEEAFLASGRPVFDLNIVHQMPVVREPSVGDLRRVQVGTRTTLQFWLRSDQRGVLRVWKKPAPGRQYVIGGDSSQGIDVGVRAGKESDPDYSVLAIMDRGTGEQVAAVRGRITPALCGQWMCDVGEWYNWAFLVPEANNTGLALIEEILRLQYPIGHIYRRNREADDRRPALLQDIGWQTTGTSKPQMIHRLDSAIRNGEIQVVDPVGVSELTSFVYMPDGKTQASEGCHDDYVIALALCVIGIQAAPMLLPKVKTQGYAPQMWGQPRRDDDPEEMPARGQFRW